MRACAPRFVCSFMLAVLGASVACDAQHSSLHQADSGIKAGDGDGDSTHHSDGGMPGDGDGDAQPGGDGDTQQTDAGNPDSGTPEPVFDASALSVDGTSGPALCVLSDDGHHLRVTIRNAGTTQTFATTVRIASDGTSYETRVKTPTLNGGESATLDIDRGPLAGYVEDWHFTITIDPDGKHGAPHAGVQGSCQDLRSRATAAMAPLKTWYDQDTGLWNHHDWWTSANQLETVIDYTRETGDATYFAEIDNTFEKNKGNNFDQFGYYDDDGWFAMAWIKAYDLTHQQKYLDMAKTIFARMSGGWTDQCGGGIYWASPKAGNNGNKNKNAIPNSLFLQVAAKLHQRTPGDNSYLDWAIREWNWFKSTGMINGDHLIVDGLNNLTDCKAEGPIFTYNQGVLVGGLVDLAAASGDASYLDEASAIAHATMTHMNDGNGILKEPGCGGDICVQFKGVFMRNLALLYQAQPLPEYLVYMKRQSDHLFAADRNDQGQYCYEWHLGFGNGENGTASRQSSALDGLISAVSSSNMNLALHGAATGAAACSAAEGAENAIDGNGRSTKWCAGGAGNQTLSVDLGKSRTVVGFRVRHAGSGGENSAWNTRDFELDTSDDGQTWSNAVKVNNNTSDVTTHPIAARAARFVRLHISAAQTATDFVAARVYELEVFGVGLE